MNDTVKQMFRWNTITERLKAFNEFKEQTKQSTFNQNINNNFSWLEKLYNVSQTATDPTVRQEASDGVRKWEIAMQVRNYVSTQWKDRSSWTDPQVINTMAAADPKFKQAYLEFKNDPNNTDSTGFAINMWWIQPETEKEYNSDTLSQLWVAWAYWLWVAWAWWAWAEVIDRTLKPYDWSFSVKENEAKSIQRDNADKIKMSKYSAIQEEAIKELKAAEKAWDQAAIHAANKKLRAAIKWHDNAFESSKTPTRKTIDTAEEYNLWWTSKANIWDKAKAKWELLFETEIVPALKNSKQTVNIQELINSIDVEDLAKWDPDKLSAYSDALEDLKNSYSDPKYAEYSMMDTQTLKSGIQGRTPQKFYKWKEITNELQELKWILGSKIKNELHSKLSAEMWENTARMYLDYANLMDIANAGVKDRAQSLSKQGFWGFQNWLKDKLLTPVSSWPWLLIRKYRKFFENIPSKIGEAWKELLSKIKSNPKAVVGKWIKWLLDPVALIMPDMREISQDVKNEMKLSFIKDRLSWKWMFKWKSEEEMEELLPIQSIWEILNNEEFVQYLYNKWIDIEKLEKQLTNMSE